MLKPLNPKSSVAKELRSLAKSRGYGLGIGDSAVARQQAANRALKKKVGSPTVTDESAIVQTTLFKDLQRLARSRGFQLGACILE